MRRFGTGVVSAVLALVSLGAAPGGRYEVRTDVVHDRRAELYWQRAPDTTARTLADAQAYCAALQLGTFAGWRVPTMPELQSLLDVRASRPAIDAAAFPDTQSLPYWTQTPYVAQEGWVWFVDFAQGTANGASPEGVQLVRCVR